MVALRHGYLGDSSIVPVPVIHTQRENRFIDVQIKLARAVRPHWHVQTDRRAERLIPVRIEEIFIGPRLTDPSYESEPRSQQDAPQWRKRKHLSA